MAKPYSYDLRRKVIEAIELDGMKRSYASKTFRISRNTINLWFRRRAETGDFAVLVLAQESDSQAGDLAVTPSGKLWSMSFGPRPNQSG